MRKNHEQKVWSYPNNSSAYQNWDVCKTDFPKNKIFILAKPLHKNAKIAALKSLNPWKFRKHLRINTKIILKFGEKWKWNRSNSDRGPHKRARETKERKQNRLHVR